jgi:hypothetical protein
MSSVNSEHDVLSDNIFLLNDFHNLETTPSNNKNMPTNYAILVLLHYSKTSFRQILLFMCQFRL